MKTLQTTLILDTVAPVAAVVKAARVRKPKAVVEVVAAPVIAKVVTAAKPKAAPKAKTGAAKGAPKAVSGIAFCLVDRPASGGNLYAFTQAVLNVSGLQAGRGISKATLTTVMGATAVRYHLNKTTFATNDKGLIVLSPVGKYSFGERVSKGQVDATLVEGYEALLREGKANQALPLAKMQINIRAVA